MSGNPTTPIPSVRVLWRPEQFNRVTNGTFETNTSGWATTAGINAAGTSITRITTDFHSGSACASVVCTSTDTSGVNFDMGSNRFYSEASYGSMYAAVVWLKRVSGSRRARVTLGSEGTSDDRATLTITDLTDQWQPYVIRWLPTANRTDVQLAVTNGSAEALTFRIDDVSVYLVDAFSQVENGTFEVDTTGWTLGSASIARSTAESFGGSACARVTAPAVLDPGVGYTLYGRTFVAGRTYRLRLAIKSISGTGQWYYGFDTLGGSASSYGGVTPTSDWQWVTRDFTPGSTLTDVQVWVGHSPASAAVAAIDEVEVYEAVDDLGTDAGDMSWSRSLEGVGTIAVEVENADGRYDPRYSSSVLYGSVAPGKRIWGRATYGGALYPLFYGTLTTIEAAPMGGVHATLLAEDMLAPIRDADVFSDFAQDDSYRTTRSWIMDSVISGVPSLADSPSSSAHESLADGLESGTLYRGTDGNVPALDLLADLNEATQSVHWVEPSVHANIGWLYRVQDRATLTDTSSDFTVDESDPPTDLIGIRSTHETLENRLEVPWQSYTKLPPSGADADGFGAVIIGYDPSVFGDLGMGDEAPYLSFTDEAYGTDEDHPDPRWHYPGGRKRWRARRKRGLKVKRRTRVYPDAVLPIVMATGEVRRFVFDFSIPVSGATFEWDALSSTTNFLADYVESRPNRLIIDLRCISADTITYIVVSGTPWLPGDELTETVNAWDSQLDRGLRNGDTIDTAYIPSPALASGVGAYRTWRYGTPRLRPEMHDHNNFPRTLTADVTDHFTVTLDRWRLSSVLFASTGCRWEVSAGALDWRVWHELEELPTHTEWLILDDATKGLDDAVVLAY